MSLHVLLDGTTTIERKEFFLEHVIIFYKAEFKDVHFPAKMK